MTYHGGASYSGPSKKYLAAWQFRLAEPLFDQTEQNWDVPCSKQYLASGQGFEILNITLPPEKMT